MGRTPEFGRVENTKVDKPWGYELRWAITDRYAGKILHLNKGEALSLQYHERKDEYQYLFKGSIDVELGGWDAGLPARRMAAGDPPPLRPAPRHPPTRLV